MPARPYRLDLEIEELPELPNRLGNRAHWRTVRTHARLWHWRVKAAVAGRAPLHPLPRARVLFTRCSSHCPDLDGLYGSVKAPLDGLVLAGVLVDDSPRHVELHCAWQKAPRGKGRLLIEVEALTAQDGPDPDEAA